MSAFIYWDPFVMRQALLYLASSQGIVQCWIMGWSPTRENICARTVYLNLCGHKCMCVYEHVLVCVLGNVCLCTCEAPSIKPEAFPFA